MSLRFELVCSRCEAHRTADGLPTVCEGCGAPYLVSYPLDAIRRAIGPAALQGRAWDMWRYREVLPLAADEAPVTLGEGGTPLLDVPKLAKRAGVSRLYVKDEGLNPTGTFKARGLSAAVTRAAAAGAPGFVIPSAGNAAGALAAYAARAGLPVRVFVPRDTPPAMVAECRALGADVVLVNGVITDCAVEARACAEETGYFDVSTLREPYRIEGKKTMGYEVAEQMAWKLPDAIIYPTGGGTGLIGMWKAFGELSRLGWLEESGRPRMYSVQAAGCAPIVRAWEEGAESATRWEEPQTVASGLRVPAALGDFLILRALRESDGAAVAVADSELLRATATLQRCGIGASPEGGATLAALHRLRESGRIRETDSVVCFNTGALLKYLR